MLTDVAQSITHQVEERPILARTYPDFEGFLKKAAGSNVPIAFLGAYSKLMSRLTREGKIRGQGELTLPRATPIWKQIAKELLEFDFYTPELARICVSYALNIATAKTYLERSAVYEEGVQNIRSAYNTQTTIGMELLAETESLYPDTGDLVAALMSNPDLAEAKAAYEQSNQLLEQLSKFEASDGAVTDKLKGSSIFYFFWHEKRVLEISPKRSWYGQLIDFVKRGLYKMPTLDQYNHWTAHIEAYFSNSQKRGRMLHRAS